MRLLLALLAAFALQTGGAASDLRFDWPKGLTARVQTERARERTTAGDTKSTTTKLSFRMQALPHAEGLLIRHDEFRVDGMPAADSPAAAEVLTALVPDLVVDESGAFVRVDNIGSLETTMRKLLEPLQKGARDLPEGAKEMFSRVTSEEALTGLAAQEWRLLGEFWRDVDLAEGKFDFLTEETTPIFPGMTIPMRISGGIVEKTTCQRGGETVGCVVAEMRSVIDPSAMEALLGRLLKGMSEAQAMRLRRFDVTTSTRLRMETRTMVPHELLVSRTVEMVMETGQRTVSGKQMDRRTSRFSY